MPRPSTDREAPSSVYSTSLRNSRITEEDDAELGDQEPLLGPTTAASTEHSRLPFKSSLPHIPVLGVVSLVCIFVLMLSTVFFGALYYQLVDDSRVPAWPPVSPSVLGDFSRAAVGADNSFCSEIGRNTLLQGGNAVDAAIATLFCIGVLDVQSAGLGGGHFMTIFNSTTRKCHVIDAREVAPKAATREMFRDRWDEAIYGWRAVAVPGELHGLWSAFTNFGSGRVTWKSLVEPTIQLMEEGNQKKTLCYPTSHALAGALRIDEKRILADPTLRAQFVNPKTKRVYKVGEQIKTRTSFLRTLRLLAEAEDPVALFYNGTLAEQMAAEFQKNGGIITVEDLRLYRSIVRDEVLYADLGNGIRGCGPPPPSGASVALAILNLLRDSVGNSSLDSADETVDFLHRFIEASKFGYAQRSAMGDIRFVEDALRIARNITSESWAEAVSKLITDYAHPTAYYNGEFNGTALPPDHGTSHVSVVDQHGNAVSVTSTINLYFGAGVASESTGIVFNDEMDDFSLPGHPNFFNITPSPSNYIVAGKRPMSSMSPLVFFSEHDRHEVLAIGAAGGSRIISGVAFAAHHVLRLNRTVKEAIDYPRLHNQLIPNATEAEKNFLPLYLSELEQRGQTFANASEITVLTAVHKHRRGSRVFIHANSDFRKGPESEPAGF